jgi:hypothetical protein
MKLIEQYKDLQALYNQGFRFNPEDEVFYTNNLKKFKHPDGYEDWKVMQIVENEYLNKRLQELGIQDQENQVRIKDENGQFYDAKIFVSNQFGDIEIIQYNLQREGLYYEESSTSAGTRWEQHVQKRLNPLYADFCQGKYDGSELKNSPFWHPALIEMYENQEFCGTLYITEGQFKAFKATHEGIPTIGLTSISHFRDKKFETLHPDIIKFCQACRVENVVILWDGDCTDISTSQLEQGKDISNRPNLFYRFAVTISEMVFQFFPNKKKMQVHFATIRSKELAHAPKGIDDLLIHFDHKKNEIVSDMLEIGQIPSSYIISINISTADGIKKLRKFFNLNSVNQFYGAHVDKIAGKSFLFQGSNYRVEKNLPVIEIPRDLKTYKRIGTDYYQLQNKPVPQTSIEQINRMYEEILVPWTLPAIKSDHGKDADMYVERYKGFTNEANHIDYQQVVDGYWNLYVNINHEPMKGEFPHIKKLLKHLFDEHFDNDMIYDYFTLLYRYPWQKLPVICLVSKQQSTGKSTFIYLMKLIFKNNMAIISNNDLTADFNSHWTSKLVVASEETLLEKKDGYEKIKSLTTAKEIMRNEKNKTATSIPCMVHFVFCSNHENDFIKIDDYDSRLWIRKVSSITEKIKKFDAKIESEIPQFVDFIMNREITYKDIGERLYFHPNDFRTEAFKNVVKHSEPTVIKEIRECLTENFYKFGGNERLLTAQNLRSYFGIRGEINYLNKVIKEYLKVERYKTKNGTEAVTTYTFLIDEVNEPDKARTITDKGRPFVFPRWLFVGEDAVEVESEQGDLPF